MQKNMKKVKSIGNPSANNLNESPFRPPSMLCNIHYPRQYACLEHPMDRGAWRATVLGVTESGHD